MPLTSPIWSHLGRILFRIVFIHFLLTFNPFSYVFSDLVIFLNDHLFHVRPQLSKDIAAGDTSFMWAQAATFLLLAIVGAAIWSFVDWKKRNDIRWNYWFCLLVRYKLVSIAFSYGISKIFANQMQFPNLSELATPLGDLLPMRFSWMFIGYSEPYQIFSGIAEVVVALLLIWRRTALLGAILAVGVFANVVMLNLSYDIPVKLMSVYYLFLSLFLVWQERERLFAFFIQNKPTTSFSLYDGPWSKKWQKKLRVGLKLLFVLSYVALPMYLAYQTSEQRKQEQALVREPIQPGVYHVELFVRNGDTIPENLADTQRWRDVIFDYNGEGSVAALDSAFVLMYGRAYFGYFPDSTGGQVAWRAYGQQLANFTMDLSEANRMVLDGIKGADSLHVVLQKLDRHFPLAERQFHWISESNR